MKDNDSSSMYTTVRQAINQVPSAAVATAIAMLTIMVMLWAGTSLNQGYEAPQAMIIPTVWMVAIISAFVLTGTFAFFAYLNTQGDETVGQATEGQPPHANSGTSRPNTDTTGPAENTGPTAGQTQTGGQTIDLSGNGSEGSTPGASNAKARADQNFPSDMGEEGNEYGEEYQDTSSVTTSPPTEQSRSRSAKRQSESRRRRSTQTEPSQHRQGSSSTESVNSDDESSSENPSLPESFYKSLRTSVTVDEYRR